MLREKACLLTLELNGALIISRRLIDSRVFVVYEECGGRGGLGGGSISADRLQRGGCEAAAMLQYI